MKFLLQIYPFDQLKMTNFELPPGVDRGTVEVSGQAGNGQRNGKLSFVIGDGIYPVTVYNVTSIDSPM